jgi:hypothetical protein
VVNGPTPKLWRHAMAEKREAPTWLLQMTGMERGNLSEDRAAHAYQPEMGVHHGTTYCRSRSTETANNSAKETYESN